MTKMKIIKASMRNGDGGVCNAVQRDNDQLAADVVVPAYLCQSNSNHRRRPPQCRGGVVSGAFEQRPVDRYFTADAAAQVVGVAGGRWPYRLRSSSRTITASSATSRSRRGRGRSICSHETQLVSLRAAGFVPAPAIGRRRAYWTPPVRAAKRIIGDDARAAAETSTFAAIK